MQLPDMSSPLAPGLAEEVAALVPAGGASASGAFSRAVSSFAAVGLQPARAPPAATVAIASVLIASRRTIFLSSLMIGLQASSLPRAAWRVDRGIHRPPRNE
jgi:hypothetical protein